MNIKTLVLSTSYSIFQASAGLLLHPYQTMQYLVEEKVFVWLTFIPTFILAVFVLLWWLSIRYFFLSIPFIGLWAFALVWAVCFTVFWQILLLYFLIRFWVTLK